MRKNTLAPYDKTKQIEKTHENIVGETKHFPAVTREWSNSIYAFNKNNFKHLPVKDNITKDLVTSYFNFVVKPQTAGKSRRMRNLIRRSSTTKVFISRPDIKQTNEKVIITAYTADREKEFTLKKLFFFNKSFKSTVAPWKQNPFDYISSLQNILNGVNPKPKSEITDSTELKNKLSYGSLVESVLPKALKEKLGKFSRLHIRKNSYQLGFKTRTIGAKRKNSHIRYAVQKNLFRNRLAVSIIKKKNLLQNLFFYSFLKWTLSMFKINVWISKSSELNSKKFIVINKADYYKVLPFFENKLGKFPADSLMRKSNVVLLQLLITNVQNAFSNNTGFGIPFSTVSNQQNQAKLRFVFFLFRYFKFKYYQNFVQKFLKKEVLALNHLYMLSLNNFKFDRYLPGLKHMISRIYNKKVELNLVNLKYLHLNSDIFSESIAIKLRKKKSSTLKVLTQCLKLVKLPFKLFKLDDGDKQKDLKGWSNFRPLDGYKAFESDSHLSRFSQSKSLVSKDVLDVVLQKMYPLHLTTFPLQSEVKKPNLFDATSEALNLQSVLNSAEVKSKSAGILSSIKYKWITGVRIEAKGRLTKRYTAARSVFKFKYKGNLRNLDYSGIGLTTKAPSIVMVRGEMIPNLQYTFVNSKKRIGAFGIKGWISSS